MGIWVWEGGMGMGGMGMGGGYGQERRSAGGAFSLGRQQAGSIGAVYSIRQFWVVPPHVYACIRICVYACMHPRLFGY
jgi:hypothetical protein